VVFGRGVADGIVEQKPQSPPFSSAAPTTVASTQTVIPATHMRTLVGSPGHTVLASAGHDDGAVTGRNVPAPWD
jgi:hypothetical protein